MKDERWNPWLSHLSNVSVAVIALTIAAGCEPIVDASSLDDEIRSTLDSLDAQTTFYAKHLPSGREIAVRADKPVNTLSIIKIPVMILAYRMLRLVGSTSTPGIG